MKLLRKRARRHKPDQTLFFIFLKISNLNASRRRYLFRHYYIMEQLTGKKPDRILYGNGTREFEKKSYAKIKRDIKYSGTCVFSFGFLCVGGISLEHNTDQVHTSFSGVYGGNGTYLSFCHDQ
jgi:hypothetical protein